jgi:hypothetical protein
MSETKLYIHIEQQLKTAACFLQVQSIVRAKTICHWHDMNWYITVHILTRLNVGHLRTHGLISGRGKGLLLSPEHQTSCRAHSTAYSVGTRVSSLGVKWSECDTGHTPPYSVKVKITHMPLRHVQGHIYLYCDICNNYFCPSNSVNLFKGYKRFCCSCFRCLDA